MEDPRSDYRGSDASVRLINLQFALHVNGKTLLPAYTDAVARYSIHHMQQALQMSCVFDSLIWNVLGLP
jgi:hypothetical protein